MVLVGNTFAGCHKPTFGNTGDQPPVAVPAFAQGWLAKAQDAAARKVAESSNGLNLLA